MGREGEEKGTGPRPHGIKDMTGIQDLETTVPDLVVGQSCMNAPCKCYLVNLN